MKSNNTKRKLNERKRIFMKKIQDERSIDKTEKEEDLNCISNYKRV